MSGGIRRLVVVNFFNDTFSVPPTGLHWIYATSRKGKKCITSSKILASSAWLAKGQYCDEATGCHNNGSREQRQISYSERLNLVPSERLRTMSIPGSS